MTSAFSAERDQARYAYGVFHWVLGHGCPALSYCGSGHVGLSMSPAAWRQYQVRCKGGSRVMGFDHVH